MSPTFLRRWVMTEPGAPLRPVDSDLPTPDPGQALVQVAGCGVCHTDLGFYYEGVRTRAPMPVTPRSSVVLGSPSLR